MLNIRIFPYYKDLEATLILVSGLYFCTRILIDGGWVIGNETIQKGFWISIKNKVVSVICVICLFDRVGRSRLD